MSNMNTAELRRINKRNVLRYALKNGAFTKPEVASALELSIPTVGQLADELTAEGLLQPAGMQASNGGRRAARLEPVANARLACGIEISKSHVAYAVINLKGEVVLFERIRKNFEDKKEYYDYVAAYRRQLMAEHGLDDDAVEGIGVSVQGIIAADQKYFASHMLGDRKVLPLRITDPKHPVVFMNDGTASCLSELYDENVPDTYIYLMLSRTVGGSSVRGGKIWEGNNLHSGEYGHMIIHPGGRKCYCGQLGHLWSYVGVRQLEDFCGDNYYTYFERLEKGEEAYVDHFDAYLDDLAIAITNLLASDDCPVIIGGYLCKYLEPYLPHLRAKVGELDHFHSEGRDSVIRIGRYALESASVGAAALFIERYLDNLQ